MVIIFYNNESQEIYVCTEHEKTKKISIKNEHLLDFIPNDDILYVENAHLITKNQFREWINGNIQLESKHITKENKKVIVNESNLHVTEDSKFIHPKHNGTIMIEDIHTDRFPEGIILSGKWNFMAIDEIGEDVLENSRYYKILLNKGKIEVVDFKFVKENVHKRFKTQSAIDAELNRILIKDGRRGVAMAVSRAGGLDNYNYDNTNNDGVIEIEIEGDRRA